MLEFLFILLINFFPLSLQRLVLFTVGKMSSHNRRTLCLSKSHSVIFVLFVCFLKHLPFVQMSTDRCTDLFTRGFAQIMYFNTTHAMQMCSNINTTGAMHFYTNIHTHTVPHTHTDTHTAKVTSGPTGRTACT